MKGAPMPLPRIHVMKEFLLKLLANGPGYSYDEMIEKLFVKFILFDKKLKKRPQSVWKKNFDDRAQLVLADLAEGNLIDKHKDGDWWTITKLGSKILNKFPELIKDFNRISTMTKTEREEYYDSGD